MTRPDRGQQEPAQLPCSRNFSQQQQPSDVQRSDLQQQQQPSDVQRGDLNPAAQPWQPAGSADTNTSESGAAASAAVNTEARRRKRGCRGKGALERRRQLRQVERDSRYASLHGQPMRERPGPRVRPRGRAPLGKVWHTWNGWVDSLEPAPPPERTEQRAGTRRGSSAAEAGVESVVEAIKIQTDAIAALAAAVEKMSRTVSNFVFAQRGSRKWASNQGQGEVREEREKKQAEKKKNAAATSIAATKSAGADAEDAEGANAEDMAEVTEERKKAEKKEKREEKERKQNQAEQKKGVKGSEKNVNAENAEKPMSAEDIAMRESARAADVSAVGEVAVKKEVGTKWSRSLVDAGADAFWASWNQSCAVVEGAQPNAMELGAGERDWVCVGDFSGNSSKWQEDASETAAVIAEAVVSYRLREEGDDMLCGVMKDAEEEEVPVAEAVSYAAAIAAVAVMAAPMAA